MLLTEAERKRFVEWLRQDSRSNRLLSEQLKTMSGLQQLFKQKQLEADAEDMVAEILEQTESQRVG